MKKNDDKNIYFEIKVGPGILLLIILAMIIYIATKYYQSVQMEQSFSFSLVFIESISSIIINVIVIALVSLILEITSLKKYTQNIVEQTVSSFEKLISNKSEPDYSRFQIYELEEHLNSIIYQLAMKKREEQKICIPVKKEDISNYNLGLINKMIEDLVVGEYFEDYNVNL